MKLLVTMMFAIALVFTGMAASGAYNADVPSPAEVGKAIKVGNWQIVKQYIQQGGNARTCIPGWPLVGDWPRCRNLIDFLFDYRKVDLLIAAVKKGAYDGYIQLGLNNAASANMPRLAKLFISKGAKVNPDLSDKKITAQIFTSPLMMAVDSGSFAVTKVLVSAGAKVNYQATQGITALGIALQKGFGEIADLLVQNGAQLNMRSKQNVTLMELAAGGKLPEYIRVLSTLGFNVNSADIYGITPLMAAATSLPKDRKKFALETIKTLLQAGADVCHKDKRGRTALDYAKKSHLKKVVALLSKQMIHDQCKRED